jgi:hypothetical protein
MLFDQHRHQCRDERGEMWSVNVSNYESGMACTSSGPAVLLWNVNTKVSGIWFKLGFEWTIVRATRPAGEQWDNCGGSCFRVCTDHLLLHFRDPQGHARRHRWRCFTFRNNLPSRSTSYGIHKRLGLCSRKVRRTTYKYNDTRVLIFH